MTAPARSGRPSSGQPWEVAQGPVPVPAAAGSPQGASVGAAEPGGSVRGPLPGENLTGPILM